VKAYKKLDLQQLYFCKASNPAQKQFSSQLFIAADPRLWPRKRGKSEGTWSLLSRAEAQDHLYVTAMLCFLFLQPVTCNREENSFSSSIKCKPLLSPATAPKI